MQGLTTKESRLGTKLRKREYFMREGPPFCPKDPREFEDPNIYEDWFNKEIETGEYCPFRISAYLDANFATASLDVSPGTHG